MSTTIDNLFKKAIEEGNLNEFVQALKNGLNFDLDIVENYILQCIDKNKPDLLCKILRAENIVHFVKPVVTKVKTIKRAIVEKSNEELTILLLKALFDLNLGFAMITFNEVVDKILNYVEKQGFVKALNYMIERLHPRLKEEFGVDHINILRKRTEENSKKRLNLKPKIEQYKEREEEKIYDEELKKIIEEGEDFKRQQKERGIIEEQEKKWFGSDKQQKWSSVKKKWDNTTTTPQIYTDSNITRDINTIIRLNEKEFSEKALKDATNKFYGTLNEELEEMGFPQSSTETQLIDEIVKYKNDGINPNDVNVSQKLTELNQLFKKKKL